MIGVVSVTKSNLTWRQARPALARPFYPSAPGAGAKNMLKKWSLDQITPWKMCNLIPEPPQVCTLYLFIDTKGFTQSRLFTVVWDPVSSSCLLRKFSTTYQVDLWWKEQIVLSLYNDLLCGHLTLQRPPSVQFSKTAFSWIFDMICEIWYVFSATKVREALSCSPVINNSGCRLVTRRSDHSNVESIQHTQCSLPHQ